MRISDWSSDVCSSDLESQPADLADQMKLIAGKLAFPRWDTAPVERLRVGYLTGYDLNDATPNAVIERNLQGWLADGDSRWAPPDRAAIEALTPVAFKAFWAPRLARSEEHTSELQSLMRTSYAVF